MTKSKNTKRALLASVLSLMLCAAMLVGSTFAWFTDSVTSGKNKIVAGNLDVELYAKDGSDYQPVTGDTNLFMKDALWEPGHVEVINLKVANLGTLALQYKLGINVASEKQGTSVLTNELFKLSDYIQFALIDGEQTYDTRDAALKAAEAATPVKLSELAVDKDGVLYPAAKATTENPAERLITLVVYMPATVGNEANYTNSTEAPEIELGVNLIATQTPYENDSFNDQYDKEAEYPKNTFTVTYKTNADAVLGEVTYSAAEENSVPADTTEFVKYFKDFVLKVQAGGQSVYSGMTYWLDKEFTQPATTLDKTIDTVYVKLSNNASVQSFICGSLTVSAPFAACADSYNVNISKTSYGWMPYEKFAMSGYSAVGARSDAKWIFTLEKSDGNDGWTALDDSYHTDPTGTTWDNMLYFKSPADSGTYRIGKVGVVIQDTDGNALYYDYAETPNSIFHISITD